MKVGTKVRNIHTDEEREIVAIDTLPKEAVEGSSLTTTVYVLNDKERWNASQLTEHWRAVGSPSAEARNGPK